MLEKRKKRFKSSKISTIIGQHTEIVGDVTFSGGLHVDGVIKGNVFATDGTDTVLTLSEAGEIEGGVHVPNVILNGKVKGDVYASGRLELASKAQVSGNVHYNLLEMEMGAEVNGKLLHSSEEERPMLSYDDPQALAEHLEVGK